MSEETKKKDPLEGITYGVTAEELAGRMGVPVEVVINERIFMATAELGECSHYMRDICPCPCNDCRFHGRCCDCIPHHLRFNKLPNCVPHMKKNSTDEPLLPVIEATKENLEADRKRIAEIELGPCSNRAVEECPCKNVNCKLHGRCCLCMDRYRKYNKLPACLRHMLPEKYANT